MTQRIATVAGRPRRNGKARFMLLLPRLREAVAARQSLRVIHDPHAKALGIGYVQFTRYIARYLSEVREAPIRQEALPPNRGSQPLAAQPPPSAATEPRRALPERRRGFHIDPMAMRSKDLI